MSIASQTTNADVVESVSPVIAEVIYTPEALLSLSDEVAYELVGGKLVERNMGGESSEIAVAINSLLWTHCHALSLGRVFGPDAGYQIYGEDSDKVRRPDGSFIAKGRLPNDLPPKGHINVCPDLVIEVVSPHDLAIEIDVKVEEYLQAGVRLIWVVYPETKHVLVYRTGSTVQRLGVEDELAGEDVLPEFRLAIGKIFPVAGEDVGA